MNMKNVKKILLGGAVAMSCSALLSTTANAVNPGRMLSRLVSVFGGTRGSSNPSSSSVSLARHLNDRLGNNGSGVGSSVRLSSNRSTSKSTGNQGGNNGLVKLPQSSVLPSTQFTRGFSGISGNQNGSASLTSSRKGNGGAGSSASLATQLRARLQSGGSGKLGIRFKN